MRFSSIKTKFVFIIAAFVVVLLLIIATGTYIYFGKTTQKMIYDQQKTTIASIARGLDANISIAHNALINVANVAPKDFFNDTEKLQKWLDNRTGIRTIFLVTLILLDSDGRLIASYPPTPDIYGSSFSQREYYKQTIASRNPYISLPFISVQSDHPVVMMTAPIFGKDQKIVGMLCGAIDLLDSNGLFGSLEGIQIGESGYVYMFSSDKTMIIHPDTSRIMSKDIKPGEVELFNKVISGFEEPGEIDYANGIAYLASFKRLKSTGWIIASNYPITEAYKPIATFRKYFLLSFLLILIGCIFFARKLGGIVADPLIRFTEQIQDLTLPDSDKRQRLLASRSDEIGVLANSFNALLDALQKQEIEVRDKAEQYQNLINNSHDIIYVLTPEGDFTYVSPAWTTLLGYEVCDVVGKSFVPFVYPEDIPRCLEWLKLVTGSDTVPQRIEYRVLHLNGEWRWHSSVAVPLKDNDGTVFGYEGIATDITERKAAEFALAEERRRLSDILAGTNVGTWEWNVQTGETIFNERWAEIIGYSLKELAPVSIETWAKFAHPDDLKTSNAHLNNHFDGKSEFYEFECRMQHKDGRWIWVLDRGRVHSWDIKGRPLLMSGTHQDITERKKMENALRDSEEKLQAVFNAANIGISITDIRGFYVMFNQWWLDYLGYSADEIRQKNNVEITHPDDREQSRVFFNKVISGEVQDYRLEKRFIRKDGSVVWGDVSVSPVRDKDETVINMIGMVNDITERKKVEIALLESEEKYRKAFITSPDSIVISKFADGTIVSVNNGFLEMTGYPYKDVIGKTILELNFWKDHEDRRVVIEALQTKGEIKNHEAVFNINNGEIFGLLSATVIVLNDETHVLTITRDITDRKIAEKKLIEAEQKSTALSMAITANHEINQPLMVLMGNMDLLDMKIDTNSEGRKYIDKMRHAISDIETILIKMKDLENNTNISFENYVDGSKMIDINKEPSH